MLCLMSFEVYPACGEINISSVRGLTSIPSRSREWSKAVEAEDEVVEVGLQVFVAQSIVEAESPWV